MCHCFLKLLLFFCLISELLYAQADSLPQFEKLGVRDGLSQNAVRAIFQDSKGWLWFATEDGLNRYDGYRFQIYRSKMNDLSTIGSNYLDMMDEDKFGNLWLGSNIAGLNKYDHQKDQFVRYPMFLKKSLRAIVCDSKNQIWVGTAKGLFRISQKEGKESIDSLAEDQKFSLLKNETVTAFCKNQNEIFMGTASGMVFSYKDDKITPFFLGKECTVKKLSQDREQNIWIATNKGLFCLNPKNKEVKIFLQEPENENSLLDNDLMAVYVDSKNRIWIGTNKNGLCIYYPEKKQFVRIVKKDDFSPFGLSDNNIRSFYEDIQGNIWIGTSLGGINKYNEFRFKFKHFYQELNQPNSLSSNSIRGFIEDQEKNWWIATQGGGVNIYNPFSGKFLHLKHDPNNKNTLSDNYVRSIKQGKNGVVWVSSSRNGFCSIVKKGANYQITRFNHEQKNIPSKMSSYIANLVTEGEYLWTQSYYGEIYQFHVDSLTFKELLPSHLDQSNIVPPTLFKGKEKLWYGTPNGLFSYHLKDGKNEQIKEFPQCWIRSIYQDPETSLFWISTNLGLVSFDEQSRETRIFDTEKGLANNAVYGVLHDKKRNHLWISSNKGLSQMDLQTETFKNYDIHDGLQDNEFNGNAYYQSNSGLFFFGGINGFNVFYPDQIQTDNSLAIPAITDFQIDNHSVKVGEYSVLKKNINETENIILTLEDHIFSFELAALHYTNPQKNKIIYFLEGFDSKWTELPSDRRFVTYTNLPHGNYVFRMKVSNADGIWNYNEKIIKIYITPPFWKTWWFQTMAILAILGIIYAVYRLRVQAIKEKNLTLKRLVNERTQQIQEINIELEQSHEEISSSKDDLENSLKIIEGKKSEILKSIHYAKTIQMAILPTLDKLKGFFAESFIFYSPRDIVSGDFFWFSQINDSKAFLAVADCTGHGVPGAFMSMIGNTLLNQIVNEKDIYSPALVLENLHKNIQSALKQQESANNDGMDLIFCAFQKQENRMEVCFASAKRPLFYGNKTELKKVQGGKSSIGGYSKKRHSQKFMNYTIQIPLRTMLYLTTDGYIDQCNAKRISFGSDKFYQLLKEISEQKAEDQQQILQTTLQDFSENITQRDDITILGVRV